MDPVLLGFVASLIAGLVTSLGALPILFGSEISRRSSDAMLGFAAGVTASQTAAGVPGESGLAQVAQDLAPELGKKLEKNLAATRRIPAK